MGKGYLVDTISAIMVSFIKSPNVPGDGAAWEANKRQNEPHACHAFLPAKLTLIKAL